MGSCGRAISGVNQQFQLPDGRLLGYDEHGPSDGSPLFYFHGSPGSRLAWKLFVEPGLAEELGIHVIVPDRPGSGHSDFQPGRTIRDWPADVVALADHLGLTRFAVLGYSGGGPYALACALTIPERLTRIGIVSGTAPFEGSGLTFDNSPLCTRLLRLVRDQRWLSRLTVRLMKFGAHYTPKLMVKLVMAALPAADRAMLRRPRFQQDFVEMVRDAVQAGPRGTEHEIALIVRPWNFCPEDVRGAVHLWHGEADACALLAMARYIAQAIPNSRLLTYPGEGHLSMMAKYAKEILNALAPTIP